jgi:ATP synthase protein I
MDQNESTGLSSVDTGAQRILAIQALLISVVAWGFYFYQNQLAAQAALYGGCIVLFNVWMMDRRVRIAAKIAAISPGKEVQVLYFAAIQRFIFTLALFIVGMKGLDLPPVPMLITFAVAQLGYFFNKKA